MLCGVKPIQITIDERTLREIDRRLGGSKRGRSAFIRESVRAHLRRLRILELEDEERRGYERKPVRMGEFDAFRSKQDLGRE